jgi:hypothetical protein
MAEQCVLTVPQLSDRIFYFGLPQFQCRISHPPTPRLVPPGPAGTWLRLARIAKGWCHNNIRGQLEALIHFVLVGSRSAFFMRAAANSQSQLSMLSCCHPAQFDAHGAIVAGAGASTSPCGSGAGAGADFASVAGFASVFIDQWKDRCEGARSVFMSEKTANTAV